MILLWTFAIIIAITVECTTKVEWGGRVSVWLSKMQAEWCCRFCHGIMELIYLLLWFSASADKAFTTALIVFVSWFSSDSSFCAMILGFLPILFNLESKTKMTFALELSTTKLHFAYLSAATVSIVFLIRGYWSSTALKWSTLNENKLQ